MSVLGTVSLVVPIADNKVVHRGFLGKKILGAIQPDALNYLGAIQLLFPLISKGLVHIAANDKSVGGRPWFRFVLQKGKFQWQLTLVLLNKSVYAPSISLDDCAGFTAGCRRLTLGGTPQTQMCTL